MNRYPTWLSLLVLLILVAGALIALPNVFGSAPAIQLASKDGNQFGPDRITRVEQALTIEGIEAETIYLQDGRVVVRFGAEDKASQVAALELFRDRFDSEWRKLRLGDF